MFSVPLWEGQAVGAPSTRPPWGFEKHLFLCLWRDSLALKDNPVPGIWGDGPDPDYQAGPRLPPGGWPGGATWEGDGGWRPGPPSVDLIPLEAQSGGRGGIWGTFGDLVWEGLGGAAGGGQLRRGCRPEPGQTWAEACGHLKGARQGGRAGELAYRQASSGGGASS